ncbi:MAG: hypothetical protein LBT30_06570 [Clostridiales bacterium]|jgi:hypothetical protein|nr:hypothetical protein [Clostridiales bacterium]
MVKFQPSDGWLFITLIGLKNPSLKDIIARGDSFNYAVFTLDEINNGLSRFVAFGFAEVENKNIKMTKKAKLFYFMHCGILRLFLESQLSRYSRIFSKKSFLGDINYIDYFSTDEYEKAYKKCWAEMQEFIDKHYNR